MAEAVALDRSIAHLEGKVHHMDCMELMASIPTGSISMVFADPPFNLNKKYNTYKDNLSFDEYLDWTNEWIGEACRVLSDEGSLFVYNIPKLLVHTSKFLNHRMHFRHWISWNANGRPLGRTLQPAHYGILYYTKTVHSKFYDIRAPHERCRKCQEYLKDYGGKEHLRHNFGYQISDVWNDIHRVRHNVRRVDGHPCQLPIHLLERLILLSTDEFDTVLDLFAGGGSAGIAAKQMGRKYIGSDIDEEYCEVSNARYDSASNQKNLDGIYMSVHLGKVVSLRDVDI